MFRPSTTGQRPARQEQRPSPERRSRSTSGFRDSREDRALGTGTSQTGLAARGSRGGIDDNEIRGGPPHAAIHVQEGFPRFRCAPRPPVNNRWPRQAFRRAFEDHVPGTGCRRWLVEVRGVVELDDGANWNMRRGGRQMLHVTRRDCRCRRRGSQCDGAGLARIDPYCAVQRDLMHRHIAGVVRFPVLCSQRPGQECSGEEGISDQVRATVQMACLGCG